MTRNAKLVTAEWLAGELDKPDLVVVDASWYLPSANRHGHAEFLAGHIPGAVFFDQDKIVDPDSELPHTLPSPEVFAAAAGALGIAADKRIVVYDSAGMPSAPRLWWMLRLFGAADVAVLDGGYPAWTAGDRPVETGQVEPARHAFRGRAPASMPWPTSRMSSGRSTRAAPRSSMPARRRASRGSWPSRGRACARAICRARSACR